MANTDTTYGIGNICNHVMLSGIPSLWGQFLLETFSTTQVLRRLKELYIRQCYARSHHPWQELQDQATLQRKSQVPALWCIRWSI